MIEANSIKLVHRCDSMKTNVYSTEKHTGNSYKDRFCLVVPDDINEKCYIKIWLNIGNSIVTYVDRSYAMSLVENKQLGMKKFNEG